MVTEFKRIKVLIAEDDSKIISLYKKALHSALYNVTYIKNGVNALTEYKNGKYDLILLDIVMPTISGVSVLRNIREEHNDKRIPIIMITSTSSSDDVKQCLLHGISGYITKPFDHKGLSNKILEYYSKHNQEQVDNLQKALIDINHIIDSGDIYEVMSKHSKLKKSDYFYLGNCPFKLCRGEIKVSDEKQIYHCAECGRRGDIVTFIQEMTELEGAPLLSVFTN